MEENCTTLVCKKNRQKTRFTRVPDTRSSHRSVGVRMVNCHAALHVTSHMFRLIDTRATTQWLSITDSF